MPHQVDFNGAQTPHADRELEVAIAHRQAAGERSLQITETQTSHLHRPYPGNADAPIPPHHQALGEIEGTVGLDDDLIARAKQIALRHLGGLDRVETGG